MSDTRHTDETISDTHLAGCFLCPRGCRLAEGKRGWCGARVAHEGRVVSAQYGCVSSLALDPIEKKPLAFFHPGSMILSVGGYGCNLNCPFCQNSHIAHGWAEATSLQTALPLRHAEPSPLAQTCSELVFLASRKVSVGNIGVAYTYNEPLVNYEFVRDCAQRVHEAGLLNVAVTNAYFNAEPWDELLPHLDAANIDLKGFTQGFYDRLGAPRGLETVKRNIRQAAQHIHVEVTTLVVPGLNDSAEEIDKLAAWLAAINPEIPLHLTRFFPQHRMLDRAPTSVESLRRLSEIARRHLARVIVGNV